MCSHLGSTALSLLCPLARSTTPVETVERNADAASLPSQEEFNVSCLTDSNADTYWESDGSQCQHWVRLTMKKGTIVK